MQLNKIENLQFKANIPHINKNSACFSPPSFPPPDDFPMCIDETSVITTRYGDDIWDFTAFGAKSFMYFSDYDETNKALFKKIMFYIIYGHLSRGSNYYSLRMWYETLQDLFRVCIENSIPADQFTRYPKLIPKLAEKIPQSRFGKAISHFNALLENKEELGLLLLNENSIANLKRHDKDYEGGQNAYIPASIWYKLIHNLDQVMDDFVMHQENLEAAYHWITKSFISNKKHSKGQRRTSPFQTETPNYLIKYDGNFDDFLREHGLFELFETYQDNDKKLRCSFGLKQFSAYLNNVSFACYIVVLFYSLMRRDEALSLRTDCLVTETDERMGELYLLVGETTKTDPDSDARWVVNKNAAKAVSIAQSLVNWKLQHIKTSSKDTPHLFQNLTVWEKGHQNTKPRTITQFDKIVNSAKQFFRPDSYHISPEDYSEALALTPSLTRHDWFKVSGIWRFNFHQLRRTLAVHFAVNQISPATGQFQMKHATREQQFHYMNNHGRLMLNSVAEQEVVNEFYAEMARNITGVVNNESNVILPHSKSPVKDNIVSFITENEKKQLMKAQKNGSVAFRKNLLGGCMKEGSCEYGGFDSITHCAGGVNNKFCSDLIIDGTKELKFKDDRDYYQERMDDTPEESPLYGALKAELKGYDRVLELIEKRRAENE